MGLRIMYTAKGKSLAQHSYKIINRKCYLFVSIRHDTESNQQLCSYTQT